MREILFRGKRADNGEWVYGVPTKDSHGETVMVESVYECEEYNCRGANCLYVNENTVGQYTGLTDTNGTKIFEGDVVDLVYNGDWHIYQVVYDVSELDFKATNGKEEYRNNFQYLTCCDEVEVIGNIHDNPELAEALL